MSIEVDFGKIIEIFERLDEWQKYPNYQLERRVDLFFSLYLNDIANDIFSKNDAINNKTEWNIIPEFPYPKRSIKDNVDGYNAFINDSFKIDYLIYKKFNNEITGLLVELKTNEKATVYSECRRMAMLSHNLKENYCDILKLYKYIFYEHKNNLKLDFKTQYRKLGEQLFDDNHDKFFFYDPQTSSGLKINLDLLVILPQYDCKDKEDNEKPHKKNKSFHNLFSTHIFSPDVAFEEEKHREYKIKRINSEGKNIDPNYLYFRDFEDIVNIIKKNSYEDILSENFKKFLNTTTNKEPKT